jgi:hypothetical protein
VSRGALWTARVLSARGALLFLLFDATIKVAMSHSVSIPVTNELAPVSASQRPNSSLEENYAGGR